MKVEHELTEINLDQTRALTLAQDRSLDEFVRDDKRLDKLISRWLDYKLAPLRTADPAVADMIDDAATFQVASLKQCEDAAELIRELTRVHGRNESEAKPIKQWFDAKKRIVLDLERTVLGRIEDAMDKLDCLVKTWRLTEQKRVDDDNRRRLEEEQRKAQALREAAVLRERAEAAMLKQARDSATTESDAIALEIQRKEHANAARALAAQPLPVPIIELQSAPKIAGQHFRDDWQIEVTSFMQVPPAMLSEFILEEKPFELFKAFLKRKANKQRERFSVPGVRAWNEPALVTKSR